MVRLWFFQKITIGGKKTYIRGVVITCDRSRVSSEARLRILYVALQYKHSRDDVLCVGAAAHATCEVQGDPCIVHTSEREPGMRASATISRPGLLYLVGAFRLQRMCL